MAVNQVLPWAWVQYAGAPLWHQRKVLGRLRPSATRPTEPLRLIIAKPQSDVYDEDYAGNSADIQGVRMAAARAIPPGLDRGQTHRFRRDPTAVELVVFNVAAEQVCQDILANEAMLAGVPFVPNPQGCLQPLSEFLDAAPLGGAAAAVPDKWVTVESTDFNARGVVIQLTANAQISGDLAVFTPPGHGAVVARNIHDLDEGVYKVLEAVHDPRILKLAHHCDPRPRRRYAEAVRDMTESVVSNWPIPGPRTVHWCVVWLERRSSAPLSHHRRFTSTLNLKSDQWGVEQHGTALRALDELICFDGTDASNLAGVE
ncbi:unnamed protein product, partial [Prorocentrum cordatum]